jgi:hypothetical protein
MYGLTRATLTLIGVATAGFLVWLATLFDLRESNGEYWAALGLLAAAGLTIALSQLLGGWTKWGWPQISLTVLLIAFVPTLVAAGWVILSGQPHGGFLHGSTRNWSSDLGIGGLVEGLRQMIPVLAFGVGLVFGLTFDTTGPRRPRAARAEAARGDGAVPAERQDDGRVKARRPVTPVGAASARKGESERE